ncbi:thioredoxin family protein [candidate division KSB1 bacterium]|nr:thioredoxin family protein [candidate division KSB1 bacterium]
MIKILTDKNFQKEVLENPEPVMVEFGADWSGACQILAPVFEQLQKDFNGQIKIGWLNIEAHKQTTTMYGIKEIPVLLFFKEGKVVDQIMGMAPRQVIAARLRDLLC